MAEAEELATTTTITTTETETEVIVEVEQESTTATDAEGKSLETLEAQSESEPEKVEEKPTAEAEPEPVTVSAAPEEAHAPEPEAEPTTQTVAQTSTPPPSNPPPPIPTLPTATALAAAKSTSEGRPMPPQRSITPLSLPTEMLSPPISPKSPTGNSVTFRPVPPPRPALLSPRVAPIEEVEEDNYSSQVNGGRVSSPLGSSTGTETSAPSSVTDDSFLTDKGDDRSGETDGDNSHPGTPTPLTMDRRSSNCDTGPVADVINYEEKEGRRLVVSGTLNKLIESLADEGASQDMDYVHDFIITHRYFTDSRTFLDLLINLRYFITTPPGLAGADLTAFETVKTRIRIRTVNVLKKWLETCWSDFDAPLLERLDYQIGIINEESPQFASVLRRQLESMKTGEGASKHSVTGEIPKANIPKVKDVKELTFTDITPLELARQLTLIESQMFRAIPKDEYLNKGFNNPELAPYMNTLIKRFNDVTAWIAQEILNRDNLKERTNVLARFLEVGQHCRELNNFNGVMEVFSSLSMTPISRLKQTWKGLSEKHKKIYDDFEVLMDPKGNYKYYRGLLKSINPPLLPFPRLISGNFLLITLSGVYLTDLTFIEENSDRLQSGLVNFDKMRMLGRLITEVHLFQTVGFPFEAVPIIREWLLSRAITYTEDELYKRSRELEPPPTPTTVPPGQIPTPPAAPGKKGLFNRMRFPSMKDLKEVRASGAVTSGGSLGASSGAAFSLSALAPEDGEESSSGSRREKKGSTKNRSSSLDKSSVSGISVIASGGSSSGSNLGSHVGDSGEHHHHQVVSSSSHEKLVTTINPLFRNSSLRLSPRPGLAVEEDGRSVSPRNRSNSNSNDEQNPLPSSSSSSSASVTSSSSASRFSRQRSFTSPGKGTLSGNSPKKNKKECDKSSKKSK